jgi:hypothetical protein
MPEEKFIVRVLRKRKIENEAGNSRDEVDQIYEQEFKNFDIGKFAVELNRKDGKETDEKSLKMANGE